jgi:hypothetical protein
LLADDLSGRRWTARLASVSSHGIWKRYIVSRLMWTFEVVVFDKILDDVPQMTLAEDQEVSGAGESHPRALSEPYVSFSTHTAATIRRHGSATSIQ